MSANGKYRRALAQTQTFQSSRLHEYQVVADGRQDIAVSLEGRGGALLYVVAASGQNLRRVRNAGNPRWSPDGNRITFERGGNIWVMERDRTSQHALTASEQNWRPNWSGDGRQIGFTRPRWNLAHQPRWGQTKATRACAWGLDLRLGALGQRECSECGHWRDLDPTHSPLPPLLTLVRLLHTRQPRGCCEHFADMAPGSFPRGDGKPLFFGGFVVVGGTWARTSDPQLVELESPPALSSVPSVFGSRAVDRVVCERPP